MYRLLTLLISSLLLSSCVKKTLDQKDIKSNTFYDKAIAFREIDQIDSSFVYFDKATAEFLLRKDSVSVGKCFTNMGYFAFIKGDFYTAQELSLKALLFFDPKKESQHSSISFTYNNVGRAAYYIKDYKNALNYYHDALKFNVVHASKLKYLNNIAKVYEEEKKYDQAIPIYVQVLEGSTTNKVEYARALTNLSFTKWLQNPTYNPLPELVKALTIRKNENDNLGQNHSYARLADYYSSKNLNVALNYAEKMFGVANKLNSPDDKLEALEKLVKLSSGLKSKRYFDSYRILEDSVQLERNKSKNQFALIRYETEKHKADNLILQKDNTEKKYQLIKQKASLVAGLTLAFFTIVVSIILYKKRKQRLELASQNAIRENQLRTSKKVHDVVANGIYKVMAEIENTINLDRDQVLDKLEDMYEKSRDLSYEEINYTDQNFPQKIAELLKSFAAENRKIVFAGNTEELWKNVNAQVKYEVEYILQELMVNMKKHSRASNVAIRFEQKEDTITIYYADNGIGMQPAQQFKNGLTNTGNRIVSINGEITFDTNVEKGLKIQLSFPVS